MNTVFEQQLLSFYIELPDSAFAVAALKQHPRVKLRPWSGRRYTQPIKNLRSAAAAHRLTASQ